MPKSQLQAATNLTSPLMILPLGRGGRGKSMWCRWLIERSAQRGAELEIFDMDRTNPSLAAVYPEAKRPETIADECLNRMLETAFEGQIVRGHSTIFDVGGGDLIIKRQAAELRLAEFATENGIKPVAVHFLGPYVDDLYYLRDAEEGRLFAPESTIVVLNEGVVPAGRDAKTAFQESISQNDILRMVVHRGAKLVTMPRLKHSHDVDERRVTYAAAIAGQTRDGMPPIGPVGRRRIEIWLEDMERAFADVSDWLP